MHSMSRSAVCLIRCLICVAWASGPAAAAEVSFDRDVRPILSENCYHCHGPDAGSRAADLRLDLQDAAHEWAIVPGDVEGSEVASRIEEADPDLVMPPPDSGRSLTPEQIDILKAWIAGGGEYEAHWAFEPPVAVEPPAGRTPIDGFINAALSEHALQPNAEADRATWLRRVSFDLTGLPPTVDELDTFLADGEPGAYERQVDRLLDSPRFGERLASDWLDAARYSDTYGFQQDRDRRVWPWRDWVVRAFNRNLPYDQFLTQQLAGDMLPDATDETILATTFNRLHSQKVEGGSVEEEFRCEYVADRTQTVATALLGLTMECCRCHDHKYDPLPQRDYYALSAYFDNIDEAGLYSYFTPAVPTPALDLPNQSQRRKLADRHAEIARLEQTRPSVDVPDQVVAEPPKPMFRLDMEEAGRNGSADGVVGNAVRLTGDDEITTQAGKFDRAQPFSVALWMQTPDAKDRAVVFHATRSWTDAGSRGYQLLIEDGRLSWSLVHFWPGDAISIRTIEPIPVGRWLHVAVSYDGSSRADGLRIVIDGKPAATDVVRDHLTRRITYENHSGMTEGPLPIVIGARHRDRGFTGGLVDEFAVFDRELSTPEIRALKSGEPAATDDASEAERHVRLAVSDAAAAHRERLQTARRERNALVDAVPQIMVMKELAEPKPSFVLNRGAYDQKGEPVEPATPETLPTFGRTPRNRLELAGWLTHPDHPLTARVAVNRYWQLLFGRGLVRTSEDFGRQGETPTHPDLLDWLARDFASDWDVKRLLRQIVLTDAYRRRSVPTPDQVAADPENKWLARGPSGPLPAEMLRDQVLFVSGLLAPEIGGEPAKPYEVEQSFRETERDTGRPLYRRSLYTYWRRTAPAPAMLTLGAAKRDVCAVKRESVTNPLQALVLQNGPQYAEAARVLAASAVADHPNDEARIAALFRRLTSQRPTVEQAALLVDLLRQQRESFDAQSAARYLAVGEAKTDSSLDPVEVAATASVAATLMNTPGVTMKR